MGRRSGERVDAGTGARVDTHPRADRLKEVWLGAVRPWVSGRSGSGSRLRVLTGWGVRAGLKPPNGTATLKVEGGERLR